MVALQDKKANRYQRIFKQLSDLVSKIDNRVARMATIAAVLHHKIDGVSWTGFYLLDKGELIVGPYQGPLACQVLVKNQGVCWKAINDQISVIVPDVHKFPGHIACDPRSKSEIVIPVMNRKNEIIGVLDIDSNNFDNFNVTDAINLEKIVQMIYQ